MRKISSVQVLAALVLILSGGCSGGASNPAIAPTASLARGHDSQSVTTNGLIRVLGMFSHPKSGYRGASFNSCPAKGQIEYVSDFHDLTVSIFAGDFAGQSPCGILTGFTQPAGLFVRSGNLYVADDLGQKVFAFHRGASAPFMTYHDPNCGGERELAVAISNDGFLYAASLGQMQTCLGSISAWNRSSGALIGNYPFPNQSYPRFLSFQMNGTLYADDTSRLFVTTCSNGRCGTFEDTGTAGSLHNGVRSIHNDADIVLAEAYSPGGKLDTFTLPDFDEGPTGVCQFDLNSPLSIALNSSEHHVFVTDPVLGVASEQKYPSGGGNGGPCGVIGTVETTGRLPVGIAVDPPEPN